ncbi:methyl-accepting chemotaxis protein [Gellertiella hungarica]|uniref:Methyl-accepting chemotaxis protein n=1 Tax=Gellertiella hungarica TaxID=1572859 RepID=A0A7W6J8W4_9HYPH|nr:methyl-accepting chemotaxis protein [Gellertiella hungarica]MBB4066048.1 methyl-accepting chemotaxis protein [Gellertiella hungarica]
MSRLSLQTLLYLIAAAPLLAFLWLGGDAILTAYRQYALLERQAVVQQLAEAGRNIAQALPAEGFATPETRPAQREATDKALQALYDAFDAWKAEGHRDPTIEADLSVIRERLGHLPTYRGHVDATGVSDLREALTILQPASAAGLDLVRRSAATIDDLDLSRLIDGYHALLQIGDAGLIELDYGHRFLNGEALAPEDLAFVLHAKNLRGIYGPKVQEYLPPELAAKVADFQASGDGAFLAATLAGVYANKPGASDPAAVGKWDKAAGAQIQLIAKTVDETSAALGGRMAERIAALEWQLKSSIIGTTVVFLGALVLCLLTARTVAGTIRSICRRMLDLADGETRAPVPFTDRKDLIGEMARCVDIFRAAAIRNRELETEAEENRVQQENERRRIEAEAAEQAELRLQAATRSLASGLNRLASGDLLCEIEEAFAPQFEALRHDFNQSVRSLRAALSQVEQTVRVVHSGSAEISAASSNLARRTESQAASLEETAASLEEISANVQTTSSRTSEVRDLVSETRDSAKRFMGVADDAINAMQAIENSSRQINQIIAVIDEIAFQTNLLALNAGVEAARAGEAGKGFAVVAQEVRELAQRAAKAAKEIKTLITSSQERVVDGVKLVGTTGQGLVAIADLVRSIHEHMDAIALSANEQAGGLNQVNKTVNMMDQATQSNAAMVQEMNASAACLVQEADSLSAMLQRFSTGVAASVPAGRQAYRAA